MSTTTRGALPYPTGAAAADVPADIQALADRLATVGAFYLQGTSGSRPAASAALGGYFYFATNTGLLSYCTGSAWVTINPALAADSVTDAEIAPNSVGTSELKDSSVDAAAIIAGAVTRAKLAADLPLAGLTRSGTFVDSSASFRYLHGPSSVNVDAHGGGDQVDEADGKLVCVVGGVYLHMFSFKQFTVGNLQVHTVLNDDVVDTGGGVSATVQQISDRGYAIHTGVGIMALAPGDTVWLGGNNNTVYSGGSFIGGAGNYTYSEYMVWLPV